MIKRSPRVSLLSFAVLVAGIVGAAALGLRLTSASPAPGDPRTAVRAAWERAHAAGAYRFTADLTQRTLPLAMVTNAGRRSREERLHLEGETNLIEDVMTLALWPPSGERVELQLKDGEALARRDGGEWQPLPGFDSAETFAPGGDFLAFLSAVREVTEAGAETRAGLTFTRYTFAVDGPGFAAHVRDQLQQRLAERGELPPGVTLDLPRAYVGMTGSGELWVSAAGYPLRQILHLQFPAQSNERAEAEVTVDFSGFSSTPLANNSTFASLSHQSFSQLLLFIATLSLAVFIVAHARSRAVYAASVSVLVISMVASPVMQAAQAADFAQRHAERAQPQTQPPPVSETQSASQPAEAMAGASTQASTETNACQLNGAVLLPGDGADTDRDTLTNYQECVLGTDPFAPDSDGDTLADDQEARGFTLGGRTWVTDPLAADSNRDGLIDAQEWLPDLDNNSLPDDTDADGTPDLFDFDNDSDGVLDMLDLSPFQATARVDESTGVIRSATRTFREAAPLALIVSDLQPGQPSLVEFQLRPTDPNHLWYALNVLDWPRGDTDGQVQDEDGATFADTLGAGGANANGDLKLIPMLEITITGARDNLPPSVTGIFTDTNGQPVTRAVYPELENYGIFVQSVTTDTKAVYVPLNLITDAKNGARVAFEGKMLYRPGTEWGNAQQVRLAWVVQALTDNVCVQTDAAGNCARTADNQAQVVHVYYDDWFLTGLNVREDHGAEVAIIYEDPARDTDPNRDLSLLGLAPVLDNTFLIGSDCRQTATGRDCAAGHGDGQRDLVVRRVSPTAASRELGEVFDHTRNGGAAEVQPWGLPNMLRVDTTGYASRDAALVTTAMTGTLRVLGAFTTSTPITPTLMFAREERARTLNLEEQGLSASVDWQGGKLTLRMSAGGSRPVETSTGLSWAMYRFAGGAWEALPRELWWEEIARRYATPREIETGENFGALLAVEAYYLGLGNGVANTVQLGDVLTIPSTQSRTDDSLRAVLDRLRQAPGGQGVEFLGNFALTLIFPDLPEAVIGNIAAAKFDGREGPRLFRSAEFKQFMAKSRVTLQTANRLGTASNVVGGIGFTLAIANLGTIVGKEVASPGQTKVVLNHLSNALNLAVQTVNAVSTGLNIAQNITLKTLQLGSRLQATRAVLGGTNLTRANVGGAAIGLIVSIGFIWGVFITTVVSNNIQTGTPQFNTLLATAIAATIVAVIFFVLALTNVGLILVALIGVIDALLQLLCGVGVSGACTGITAWLTEQIAKLIYGYSAAVTVSVQNTQFGPLEVDLVLPSLGLRAGNILTLRSTVTTTLVHQDPASNFYDAGTVYDVAHFWSRSQLVTSKFNYAYNARPADVATTWTTEADHTYQRRGGFGNVIFEQPMYRGRSGPSTVVGSVRLFPGINAEPAYLVSQYDLPGVECERWVSYSDCDEKRITGASGNSLDILLDVFPATLTEFYRLEWGRWSQLRENFASGGLYTRNGFLAFGPQRDFDGDGLLSRDFGGADPDDAYGMWDTDRDGLSDAYELAQREQGLALSPNDDDTDGDCQLSSTQCFTDGEEERWGTNPAQLDSDGDGLLDREEIDGWTFTVLGLSTRATSDPLLADTDGDGMTDKAERDLHRSDPAKYPYHPHAFNHQPVAITTAAGGVSVVAGEGQTFVAPGAQLAYTTTVRNNISAALYAQGTLTVTIPSALGGRTSVYPLDYFGGDERSFRADVNVPANAASQRADITNSVFAQLQPGDPTVSYLIQNGAETRTVTETTRPRQWSLITAPRGNEFVTIAVEGDLIGSGENNEKSAWVVFRAQRNGAPFAYVLDDIRANFGNANTEAEPRFTSLFAVDVACAGNGNCMAVWVRRNDEGSGNQHYDVRGAIIPLNGAPGQNFNVGGANDNPNSGRDQERPVIATDGNNFMVAWLHDSNSTANNLHARRFSNTGAPLGIEFTAINADSSLEQTHTLDLAYMGNVLGNRYMLAWNEFSSSQARLYTTTLTDDGPLTGPVLVRALPGNPAPGLTALTLAYDTGGTNGGMLGYVNNRGDENWWLTSLPASGRSCNAQLSGEAVRGTLLRVAPTASGNWVAAYTSLAPGTGNVRVNYQLFRTDCTPRGNAETYTTGGLRPDALGLACRGDNCALTVSQSAGGAFYQLFQRAFQIITLLPVGPTLAQSKVDPLRVDADPPASSFAVNRYTLAAQDSPSTLTVSGSAVDSGAGIARVEVSVNAGPWQTASGLEAWAFNFDVPAGAGTYSLRSRATDLLGLTQTTPGEATVVVTGAAPQVATAIANDALLPALYDDANLRWAIALNGTVADAGSGVQSVEVRVTPNGSEWVAAQITGTTWSLNYPLAIADADGNFLRDPSGRYAFEVRASDRVGNVTPDGQTLTRTIRLDAAPPRAALVSIGDVTPPNGVGVISQAVTLTGVISDTGSGVASAELSLTDIQTLITPTLSFEPLALAQPDALETMWAFAVPANVEGFYEVDVRGADLAGNRTDSGALGLWRGEIDTLAPRVAITATVLGSGSAARTQYRLTATDLNLTEAGLTLCGNDAQRARTYYDSAWYRANHGDPTRLYTLALDCTVPGIPATSPTVTVCDAFAHCTAVTPTLPSPAARELDVSILTPPNGATLVGVDPVEVSGGVLALANLQALTLTVDGATVYTQTWELSAAVTDTTWLATWPPAADGAHTLLASVSDWAGRTVNSENIVVTLDTLTPTVTLSDTLITAADLVTASRADLTGSASDSFGIASVEVSVDGGLFAPATLTGETWRFPWPLPDPADGSYAITVRATDNSGQQAETSATVIVDVTPPDPATMTLSYVDAGGTTQPLVAGAAVRDAQSLVIEWTDSGALSYRAGWTESATPDPAALTEYDFPQTHTQPAGEARAVYAHLIARDANGNTTTQTVGPVVVDAPNTPDYVTDLSNHGWMQTGCTWLDVDRQPATIQRLFASWNSDALRLAWTGANWDTDGDLFIYLDTVPGGAVTTFNPYTQTALAVGLPFAADYAVQVEDARTATLLRWNGSAWTATFGWSQFQIDTRLDVPHTDVLLPFAQIGNPASLRLVAFATEEEALRLWSALPAKNPRNSARVVSALAANLNVSGFSLTQAFEWNALGAGACVNAGQRTEADVRMTLSAEPAGVAVSFLGDGWLALQPGARLDANGDGLPDVPLPTELSPQPLGAGQTVTYTLNYSNEGTESAANVRVTLSAFGALQLAGGRVIDLGTLAPGARGSVQIVAQVGSGAERSAELDAVVGDSVYGDFEWLWALHPVDRAAPTNLAVRAPLGFVRSGPAVVSGVVEDASGIREVRLRVQPLPSGPATTLVCPDVAPNDGAWSCPWDVSAPAGIGVGAQATSGFQLTMQAVDVHGNLSAPSEPVTVQLDDTPPSVNVDNRVLLALSDGVLTPGEFIFTGRVLDNARPQAVRACLTRGSEQSCVEADAEASTGAWAYSLPVLESDGLSQTLTLFGRDAAGNLSEPLRFAFEVDNIGPAIALTLQRRAIVLGSPAIPVLSGLVGDANGTQVMTATMQLESGLPVTFETVLTRTGDAWSFTPRVPNDPASLGRYLIRVYTQDGVGNVRGFGPYELRVVAGNSAPIIEAGPNQITTEGATVFLGPAIFTDTDTLDRHTAIINWGDGTPVEPGAIVKPQRPADAASSPITGAAEHFLYLPLVFNNFSFGAPPIPPGVNAITGSHVYADNGTYTAEVCVMDEVGARACDTFSVSASNAAPTINAGGDRTVEEGAALTVTATFNDKGTLDTHTATINWGDGTPAQPAVVSERPFGPPGSVLGMSGSISAAHVYADDGVHTVEVCVRDDDGLAACDALVITVRNVAPRVNAGPDQTVTQGFEVQFNGSFTDPGARDTHTILWDFGDGVTQTGTLTPTHLYFDVGVYTATLTVTDDDGGVGRDTARITVQSLCGQYPLLDKFSQPDGVLGGGWLGDTTAYAIRNRRLEVTGSGDIVWPENFGAEQVACITLTQVDPHGSHQAILLKVQGDKYGDGAIAVYYDAETGELGIEAFTPGLGQQTLAVVSTTLYDGAQLAGRARANGKVQLYVNGELWLRANSGAYFAGREGRIGLSFHNAADAVLDNFIGGD